ncbi:MAG TPA: Amuc_1102 family pilus-like protein [Chthoniobacterales bacterium]|nr:Amuc_1102 family pilus-like protein [Chthoniobacterales bacterium]
MRFVATLSAVLLGLAASTAPAQQPRGPVAEFQITKIARNLITAPQYSYNGAQAYDVDQRERWLEVEVEFAAGPEFTDELTLKYYILINGKMLTGEVTHANILTGRDHRSVMYVTPQTLTRFMGNRPVAANSVSNIAVQLLQKGAVKSESSLGRGAPHWFASLPPVTGFVLNKNETPFAPLYWDRYEQIKAAR